MNRRTIVVGLACLALPLGLWGCGEAGDGPDAVDDTPSVQEQTEAPAAEGDAASAVAPEDAAVSEPAPDAATSGSTGGEAAIEPELSVSEDSVAASVPVVEETPAATADAAGFAPAYAGSPVYGGGNVISQTGISVAGSGQVAVVPDAAQITFGVDTQAANAADALAANAAAMQKVLAALEAAGVAKKDIQTQQVSVGQRYDEKGQNVVGYTASNQVLATVRTIGSVGAVMDAAVKAGATNVYGLGLIVSKPDEAYAKALEDAVAAARTKAERLAKAGGVTLGKVIGISEGGGGYGGPIPLAAESIRDKGGAPIEVGTQLVTASVTVTFAVG